LDRKKAEDAENESETVKPEETEPTASNISLAAAEKSIGDPDAAMDVDDGIASAKPESSRPIEPVSMQADEDDALEY
jgi:hypothetical protein